MKQFLPKNATVLELGACLGVVSCITNRLLEHPERQVVVEANPNVIPIIEENKARNQCKFNIEHCIVSSQPVNTFFIGKNILTSSNLRKSAEQITVTGKTVAQLEQQYGLTFDVLIMDIEGGELGFLREKRGKLEQFNVVFMEIHPHPEILSAEDVAECLAIMEAAGLQKVVDEANFWVMVRPKTA